MSWRVVLSSDIDNRDIGVWRNRPCFAAIYDRSDGEVLWAETYDYCDDQGWDHSKMIPAQYFDRFEDEEYGLVMLESPNDYVFFTGSSGYPNYPFQTAKDSIDIRTRVLQQLGIA